jgi:hypothetical protein
VLNPHRRVAGAFVVTLAVLLTMPGCGKTGREIVYIDSKTGEEVPPPSQQEPDQAAESTDLEVEQPDAQPEPQPPLPVPPQQRPPSTRTQSAEQPRRQPPRPASTFAPEPTATPSPAPTPAPIRVTLPAGTLVSVEFMQKLSSHESVVGQAFTARVIDPVVVVHGTAVPAGSFVRGTVAEAKPAKKVGGRARLSLDFDTLEFPSGEVFPFHAVFSEKGKSSTGTDAAIIGGATVGGAILGHQVDDEKGKEIGAVVGAIAGAIATSQTKAKPVELAEGAVMTLETTQPITVEFLP